MSVIGTIHRGACAACVFNDWKEGGCTVGDEEMMDNLIIALDVGTVSCGCFKALEGGKA